MTVNAPGNSRLFRSIILIVIVLSGGVGIAGLLYAMREEPPRRAAASPPPLVESLVVSAEQVTEWFAGYGTARPDRAVNLAAEVASTVIELVNNIEAGSVVIDGQLLIRLDDREYRYALERARALTVADQASADELVAEAQTLEKLIATAEQELRVTRDERDRLSGLFERGLAAKKEFDFANLAYQQARRVLQGYQMQLAKNAPRQARFAASKMSHEADARLAELKIERCEITAPFGGTIETLSIDMGDRVAPGSVVLTLIDPSHIEIPIRLPASVYDRVGLQASCRMERESTPGIVWLGRVARIAASVDEQTRTFPVYVDVDNAKQSRPLIPGTFVRAEVQGPIHQDGILVPRAAIREGRVLVAEGGVARRRSVTIERLIGDRALVEGEVRIGDRLILSHLDKLASGTPVRTRGVETLSSGSPPVGGQVGAGRTP